MIAPRQILTAAQMRAEEERLIAAGTSVDELMERAGRGAADWVFRVAANRSVTVLCGPGNNGGDGYVIARVLAERGVPVQVVAPLAPATPAAQAARARHAGPVVSNARGHVLVDCLFGTGLARPLAEDLQALLLDLLARHQRRIAVDLPSGVDSDSGLVRSRDLPAYHLTLALGAWKRAHWLMPAAALMGERRLVDIGLAEVQGAAALAAPPRLRAPAAAAHKYARGLVAVVSGAMPGAAMLAARAAMHGGAGYVKLLSATLPAHLPDALVSDTRPLEEALADERISAMLVGPGLGRDAAARERLTQALQFAGPLVLDADALVLLRPGMLAGRDGPLVLTPHAGELAALAAGFGLPEAGKTEQAQALADRLGAMVIAKGPDTVIASAGQPLTFMPPAASWLSVAGTGDVLAGLVASRLATTPGSPREAAIEALWLHAEAARLAGPAFSANDLIIRIPEAWRAFL